MELTSARARLLAALTVLVALTGCTSNDTPEASPSPASSDSTQRPAETSNPAVTPSIDPQPSVGTAPGDDPPPSATELSWRQSEGATYLVADRGDSDAIAHDVTFRIDESGCLRADVADRGEGLFVALHAGYTATADGIESSDGEVARFGEPVTAQQMAGGVAPADYEAVCGPAQPDSIFAPEDISGR